MRPEERKYFPNPKKSDLTILGWLSKIVINQNSFSVFWEDIPCNLVSNKTTFHKVADLRINLMLYENVYPLHSLQDFFKHEAKRKHAINFNRDQRTLLPK